MQGVAAARFHMGDVNMNIAGKDHAKAAPFFLQCSPPSGRVVLPFGF